jgi:hypothetical protein
MATILPQGDALRKAITWYAQELKAHPDTPRQELVNKACIQFNLSPADAEALMTYTQNNR